MTCTFGTSFALAASVLGGADVTIANRLSTGHGQDTACTIIVDGLPVGILWHHNPGDMPDQVTVIPPPGYYADPPMMVVPEGQNATARVRQILMG